MDKKEAIVVQSKEHNKTTGVSEFCENWYSKKNWMAFSDVMFARDFVKLEIKLLQMKYLKLNMKVRFV